MDMTDLKACRICLISDVKMFKFDSFQLKPIYEEIVNSKISYADDLPQYFCYECSSLLYKYHKFREKCHSGQKVFRKILWNEPLSYGAIAQIDRSLHNLTSSLSIQDISSKNIKEYQFVESQEDLFKIDVIKDEPIAPVDEIEENDLIINNMIMNDDNHEENHEDNHDEHDTNDDFFDDDERPLNEVFLQVKKEAPVKEVDFPFEVVTIPPKTMVTRSKASPLKENKDKEYEPPKKVSKILKSKTRSGKLSKLIEKDREKKQKLKEKRLERNTEKAKEKPKIPPNMINRKRANKQTTKEVDKRKAKTIYLNSEHWKVINFTEEEAMAELKLKTEDPKYVKATFKCTDCYKVFAEETTLNRHLQLRHTDSAGMFPCGICKIRFRSNGRRTYHVPSHYTKYQCLRCSFSCPLKSSALFHDEYHNGVIRKCKHCGEEFKHASTYYTHIRTAHRSDVVCPICGVSFVSPAGLLQHTRLKHYDRAQSPRTEEEEKEQDVDLREDEEDQSLFCERCNIRFETRQAYQEHLVHSALHEDGMMGKRKRPRGKGATMRKPTNCNQCGKFFESQAAYKKHHLAEHPRTSFYGPNDRIICEICGASLSPISIASHVNSHTRSKVYSCDTCGRQFSTSTALKRHLLTHTGEKPIQCGVCFKRFAQKGEMKTHYKRVHLKEPYPKRERKKKSTDPPEEETIMLTRYYANM